MLLCLQIAVGGSGMWLTGIYSTMEYCRVTDTLTGQDAAPLGACGFAVGLAFGQIFPWGEDGSCCAGVWDSYLVDPASSHMLVSKIKPCMSKYKQICTVKLRMAH
jgi:hypothetical protein